MAKGDVFSAAPASVAAGAYLTGDIRPASGSEATVHNIYSNQATQVEVYDGTNSLIVSAPAGTTSWLGYVFHVTNAVYLRVKNTSGSTALISFDGVYSK